MDNLAFSPRHIEAIGLRAGEGAAVLVAMAIIQRTTALRAYNAFSSSRDWMEKLSHAYVVALATRSADTYLMRQIQNCIVEVPVIPCAKCREATLGTNVIRSRLFPELAALRKQANALIHYLDNPRHRGMAELNVQGVFDYCYHLFHENADLLFGRSPEGSFPYTKCKECRAKNVESQ
ncbi:hypothetical protein [Nitrosomonas supralitoralis]|uniref:Uncharacterized protein n=1 Tax=Nitrosomonas supralitoralis TaxID=2116706 RepID=A0A2P7NT72_9PROT|nr:hypothetical protein [Nitrosomonas supralitoralis]PSJ16628.1 hypothetical protein C7H79_12555 [Nitrosomonas supralitoralis]